MSPGPALDGIAGTQGKMDDGLQFQLAGGGGIKVRGTSRFALRPEYGYERVFNTPCSGCLWDGVRNGVSVSGFVEGGEGDFDRHLLLAGISVLRGSTGKQP